MKRTTAGVNYFRVTQKSGSDEFEEESDGQKVKSARVAHDEIANDNRILRLCANVHEKTFDIGVDDQICEMRTDTQLVLVDIPGINEADSNKKYKDYVASHWNTFDCVIVVMDAIQGVNTQEQVELLKFVQANNETKKKIPTIILGNKMDDPNDEEKIALVAETRAEVMKIFGNTCSESSLRTLLTEAKKSGRCDWGKVNDGAIFIPISAMNAFIYKKASHLISENFDKFDADVVDRIGQAEVGRKWKKLSNEQKVDVIREAISDPSEYKDRLEGTNFESFLAVLVHFIGGEEVQSSLINKQIDVCLRDLGYNGTTTVGVALDDVFKKCNAIGRSTEDLPIHFWRVYRTIRINGEQQTNENIEALSLIRPFTELEDYYTLARKVNWQGEQEKVVKQLTSLVRWQLSLVDDMLKAWTFDNFLSLRMATCSECREYTFKKMKNDRPRCIRCRQEMPADDGFSPSWKALAPHDWMILFGSILLPSNEMEWYKNFGKEKIQLEQSLILFTVRFNEKADFSFQRNTSYHQHQQNLSTYLQVIRDEESRKSLLTLQMPEDISDPSHWGHLSWKYVKFCRSIDINKS
jgi:signal recognition particle receptor subunit beta